MLHDQRVCSERAQGPPHQLFLDVADVPKTYRVSISGDIGGLSLTIFAPTCIAP